MITAPEPSKSKVQEAVETIKSPGTEINDGGAEGNEGAGKEQDIDLNEDLYSKLLYPQLELNNRERVERQLVLIQFMTRKLKDAFNTKYFGVHQRKGKVIEEVQRLTKRKRQLKEELAAVKQEQGGKEGVGKGMGLSVGGIGIGGDGGSSRSMSDSGRPASALQEAFDDDDYDPRWMPEERPELLLQVDDSEVSTEEIMSGGTNTPSTARAASRVAGEEERQSPSSARTPTVPPSVGSDVSWAESRAAFLAGPHPYKQKATKTPIGPDGRGGKDWTWAEARAWREWRAAQEEEQRKRRAHVNTLNLQLERVTPTIK
ncbi:hypothetical protein SK128_021149, partial [Halocaridina rubra]